MLVEKGLQEPLQAGPTLQGSSAHTPALPLPPSLPHSPEQACSLRKDTSSNPCLTLHGHRVFSGVTTTCRTSVVNAPNAETYTHNSYLLFCEFHLNLQNNM